jgi:pescadillo
MILMMIMIDEPADDFIQNSFNGNLFQNHFIYISREVPLYLTKFIIDACGGKCGWDSSINIGSPFDELDTRITIQISDRPSIQNVINGREYLQPQWLYDCVNANKLVKTVGYHLGEKLPAHLSPFVVAGADDYIPGEIEVCFFNLQAAKIVESNDQEDVQEQEEKEVDNKELAKIMMSKRDRKLYDKMQYGKQKKRAVADKLREKKALQ